MKMVFEVGDVVRLISTRPFGWNSDGKMDKFLGTLQVVKFISGGNVSFVNPETHKWLFCTQDIAGYENDKISNSQISLLADLHSKFPEGQKFFSAMSGKKFTSKGLLYGKNEGHYFNVLDKGENYVYYQGKVAELRTAKPCRPALTFNGAPVSYNSNTGTLSIGCKNVDIDDLEVLEDICSHYNITSITVDGSRTVTASDLRTWIDFVNKQQ